MHHSRDHHNEGHSNHGHGHGGHRNGGGLYHSHSHRHHSHHRHRHHHREQTDDQLIFDPICKYNSAKNISYIKCTIHLIVNIIICVLLC